ncbi:YitT family protein [Ureibacillus sp. MALMAid1270]|uniref:YitT family protein n=1 Tax=Ureibacillus sp. MALMAid1270 TaxID=3411629 RepID=UPI003BA65616
MKAFRPYKNYLIELAIKIPWIFIGAMMAAVSLEVILIPHGLIDGGITGVSMMLSGIGGFPLSVLLFLLNIPFLLLGLKFLGKRFAFSASFGIIALAISTGLLERKSPFLEGNTILILIIGGILLGMGIGIVIRNGGVLDGTDVLALLISKKTRLTIGEAIFVINIFIFLLALLLFGWKGAVISIITYFIAVTVVDMVRVNE